MMPTVGFEEAFSAKFVSPATGMVSTAGAMLKFLAEEV